MTSCYVFLLCGLHLLAQVPRDSLVQFSQQFIGKPYCYGSYNPSKGFDCSGFVYYVFQHYQIKVPRSSKDYAFFGEVVTLDSCKAGDVLVFKKPGHVGIVVANTKSTLKFIHSSSDKRHSGVKISDFYAFGAYRQRFVKVVRIKELID